MKLICSSLKKILSIKNRRVVFLYTYEPYFYYFLLVKAACPVLNWSPNYCRPPCLGLLGHQTPIQMNSTEAKSCKIYNYVYTFSHLLLSFQIYHIKRSFINFKLFLAGLGSPIIIQYWFFSTYLYSTFIINSERYMKKNSTNTNKQLGKDEVADSKNVRGWGLLKLHGKLVSS